MAKSDSFKKKELDKKDYQGKDTVAKVVKAAGVALTAVGAVISLPKLVEATKKLLKNIFS